MNLRRASLVLAVIAAAMVAALVALELRDRAIRAEREGGVRRLPPPLSWMNTPPPGSPFELRLEGVYTLDPLDMRDVGLGFEGDPTVVGIVGERAVSTREVDERGVGILRRIGQEQVAAEKRALVWLAEREALEFEAKRAGQPLDEMLLAAYQAMPPPREQDLEPLRPPEAKGDDPETEAAVRTRWRLIAWRAKRSLIVKVGAQTERIALVTRPASMPVGLTPPQTDVVALIGQREVTRDEVRRLAGLGEWSSQNDYYHKLKTNFDAIVTAAAVDAEATRLRTTVMKLYEKAEREYPRVTEAQVTQYIEQNPIFRSMPDGRKKARVNLELARNHYARVELEKRLRDGMRASFQVKEPEYPATPLASVRPLVAGQPRAKVTLVALHAFGSRVGQEFGREIERLVADHGHEARFEILPHYPSEDALIPYRAALALYCAQEQGRLMELFADLVSSFQFASIKNLTQKAQRLGLNADRFRQCLEEDRYLPFVFENRLLAERVGLDDGEPALFVQGRFVENFRDPARVAVAIDQALGRPPRKSERDGGAVSAVVRDGGASRADVQRDGGGDARGARGSAMGTGPIPDGGAPQGALPGDLRSDPILADLQALKAKVEGDVAQVRRALGRPNPAVGGGAQGAAAAASEAARAARRVSEAFASYRATTPEVRALATEAAAAWRAYAIEAERLAAASAAADSARAGKALQALGQAHRNVQTVMEKITRAFRERGL